MVGLNAYTLCSGIICEELNGDDYIAVPFESDEETPNSIMEIGYITKSNTVLSKMGKEYIEEMEKYLNQKKWVIKTIYNKTLNNSIRQYIWFEVQYAHIKRGGAHEKLLLHGNDADV